MRILLLDIDGLQPAYLGPFGCEWVPTPTLDRWSAAGVVFDQHFAARSDAENRGWRFGGHAPAWPDKARDLLDDLRSAGIRTGRVGPPRPADDWDVDVAVERGEAPLSLNLFRRGVREAIKQLGDSANTLLRIEIDALLPPWRPAEEAIADCFADEEFEPWAETLPERIAPDDDAMFARLQHTYAAAVATIDAGLEKLLGDCHSRGWGDDALRILTAGRGFPLGEHGAVGFAAAELHEELVHLPLMVRWPRDEHAGLRTSALTQPPDLAAAIGGLFGRPAATGFMNLARGSDQPIRDRAVTRLGRGNQTLLGFRSPEWYLMLDDAGGQRRLFVKPDDRWEVNDVLPRNIELADEMEKEFREKYRTG